MATIKKRGKNTFSVVYYYTDENGERKQKWETYHSYKEAVKRKAEVENQQFTGAFVSPSKQTVREFLYEDVYKRQGQVVMHLQQMRQHIKAWFMQSSIRLQGKCYIRVTVLVGAISKIKCWKSCADGADTVSYTHLH